MKRAALTVFLLSLPFHLTACRVNWFDRTLDVPWWIVAIYLALWVTVPTYLAGRSITGKKYACPSCGQTFYPKFWAAVFSFHMGDLRTFRCPHCGKKDLCGPSYDQ